MSWSPEDKFLDENHNCHACLHWYDIDVEFYLQFVVKGSDETHWVCYECMDPDLSAKDEI